MSDSEEETIKLNPANSCLSGILLNQEGAASLTPDCDRGTCLWEIYRENKYHIISIRANVKISPPQDIDPLADVIIQLRWMKNDGTWSFWFPENLLTGGDFRDRDQSGLPDFADIIEWDQTGILRSDLPKKLVPSTFKKHIRKARPPLIQNIGELPVLTVRKPRAEGQTIVQMRSDRIPHSRALTISGWNGWDLGDKYTMGLMSRFHEIDRDGNRLNKIMFIGDDDFNQRGGVSPLKWRAASFVPRWETRRLNLYPIRLIGSPGTIMASRCQIREDSLFEPRFRGAAIPCPDVKDAPTWLTEEPELVELNPEGVTLLPKPLGNAILLSPIFEIPAVDRVALSIEMDVTVPERYDDHDPSHKAWMSTYLEFLDDEERVIDVLQITACRPLWSDALVSAVERPRNSKRARLRLVASHKTYLGENHEKNMDGLMLCRWRNLEMFESLYPQTYRARLDEEDIKTGEIPASEKFQIRAILLSDRNPPSPVLESVQCILKR